MKKRILWCGLLLVCLVLGLWWRHHQQTKSQIKSTIPATVVTATSAKLMPIPSSIETVGTLQAKQSANISAELAGKVVKIPYQPGTLVAKDTLLIQLDDQTYQAALASDVANLNDLKVDYHRYLSLAKWAAESAQSLDQAKAKYLQAQAKVDSDKALLAQTKITAPFAGYVTATDINIGDYVQAGQTLMQLVDRTILQVYYQLPERYLPQLKLGQLITLTLADSVGAKKTFTGQVTYIAPQVDVDTHTIQLQAEVINTKNALTPGLLVRVKQDTGINAHAIVVPQESIVPTIDGAQVYKIVKGRAKVQVVQLGGTINGNVEIISGVQAGDLIITTGQQDLKDGDAVKEVMGK